MALGIYGKLWRTSRQVRLLCPWARHLTGRPTFMWKTGDPEMATPKRVRTYRPKHSDTSLSREWRIKMANNNNKNNKKKFTLVQQVGNNSTSNNSEITIESAKITTEIFIE